MPSCGCAMIRMPPCGYVMMQMPPCRYAMMRMSLCRYVMMQMPPYGCVMMRMSAWECAMMRMFWCKHNLFKNSRYFQNKTSSAPETKIFSKLDLLFLKNHLLFDLRLLKNWWTVRNLRIGHLLEIWWFGSKDLFSQIWLSNGMFPRPFSGKTNSLKIKHFKKIHFFLVFEYGNLTGVKIHHDRLRIWGKAFLDRRFRLFDFGRGWGPHKCFGCYPVVASSFFCLLHPRIFDNFLALL